VKVVMVVCWIMITLNIINEVYSFMMNDDNLLPLVIVNNYWMPKLCVYIIKIIVVMLNLLAVASWAFPQAMNYLVMTFLYDQFSKLSEEFSKCISDRGKFIGNFEEFRRRHQAISRSVQEADRFLMISNVAVFCSQIINIILILYSTVFFREETMIQNAMEAVFYIVWLGFNMFALVLAAGLAIIINHAVSLWHICNIGSFTFVL